MSSAPGPGLVPLDDLGRPGLGPAATGGREPAAARRQPPARPAGAGAESDAVVVGGGPAGSAFAAAFADRGWRVLLLDGGALTGDRGGESLLPTMWPILGALGVAERVAGAGFVPKAGGTFVVGPEGARWNVLLGGGPEGPPASRQVRRAELDRILLEHAAARGAEVRTGWRATEVVFEDGRAAGVRAVDAGGRERRIGARWTVDASGSAGLVGCALGLAEYDAALRNRVLWSYWTGSDLLPGECAGNTTCVQHPKGWLWHLPLDDRGELVTVGVVLHESAAEWSSGDPAAVYHAAVAASDLKRELLRDARPVGEVQARAAAAYCSSQLAGPGWLLAGDAACFLDPLLTSGVQLACHHALVAAQALSSAIDDPGLEPEALAYYQRWCRRLYEDNLELCLNLYGHRPRPASPAGPSPPGGPGALPADVAARLGFLSLVSGLPGPEIAARLATLAARGPAAGGRGGAVEALGLLFQELRRRRLDAGRAQRVRDPLGDDVVIRLSPGVTRGTLAFQSPPGGRGLRFATAVENRFGDRFQATAELDALLAALRQPGGLRELEGRLPASGRADGALGTWLEDLADNCLVEWRRCGS